ncbi:uncharacterized protein FSUBG_2912 [Fusarium subglutinans]|uniref:Uncharacterized protein n=1 Tax=Gibberella subglutinans TaxID=42677 RepID=A0A8H5V4T2_GIBSU|nr:uncharacterized protein FSUBG_2912 [Fusarium subglutinans]KAF5610651.1 hypothetical protein FSUBG_2912 [Fusarium subglutinans]
MDPDWKEVKHLAMQGRLQSLRLRIIDLANNLDNSTTRQLGIHCGAIMEDIRSLSYDCIVESRDRLDEFQFYWRMAEIEVLIQFCIDEELQKIGRAEKQQPRMTTEKRREMMTDLRFDIPFTEMCFIPFDAYDFFMSLGQAFKDLIVDELRDRAQDDAMASLQSVKEDQSIKEEEWIKEVVSEPPRPELHLPGRFITNDELKQQFRDLAVNFDNSSNRWAKQQIDAYQRYLQLPVTDKMASAAVEEYNDCVSMQMPCPPGMSLLLFTRSGDWWFPHPVDPSANRSPSWGDVPKLEVITMTREQLRDDHEFVADAFKKEVPEIEPRLEQLDIDFDKVVASQYGFVVAWKYVGGDDWFDRYGHVVPELVVDQSFIHHGRRFSETMKEGDLSD